MSQHDRPGSAPWQQIATVATRMVAQNEVSQLLHWMPIIVKAPDVPDWDRKFCASITGRMRRGAFAPSPKQLAVMRKIVDRFGQRMA